MGISYQRGFLRYKDFYPSQNYCAVAQEIILPQNRDLNPIKNLFHLRGSAHVEDTKKKNISKETLELEI